MEGKVGTWSVPLIGHWGSTYINYSYITLQQNTFNFGVELIYVLLNGIRLLLEICISSKTLTL